MIHSPSYNVCVCKPSLSWVEWNNLDKALCRQIVNGNFNKLNNKSRHTDTHTRVCDNKMWSNKPRATEDTVTQWAWLCVHNSAPNWKWVKPISIAYVPCLWLIDLPHFSHFLFGEINLKIDPNISSSRNKTFIVSLSTHTNKSSQH